MEAEPAAQDPDRRAADRLRELERPLLLFLDQVGAQLGVPPILELATRPHPATHSIARFEEDGLGAAPPELTRGRQAG